ncbi:hypothetical protein MTER_16530 [Mycolicibacter terrae]|uniref:Transmembrane protein n=2 Tax=Mycolicibacter terrae TaxID=1788 RepID=A0AAD1MFA5_9MYCO|nr:hypothetical protein AWC28_14570 [Mycolicibacter terrae]BBX22242.1 hypothetical protein MTER_16530 [Mycolicibacter terrae]SNV77211.1 transmembrane protein [Mycolicibacter terrae]
MKHGPELGFDDDGRPVLITAAAPSFEQQHRERVRKYLTLMAFRVPALVLAAIAYGIWHNGLISLLILVGSIPLPWMAVLIANDRPPRSADEPRRYDGAPTHTPLFPTAPRRSLDHPRPADPEPGAATCDPGSEQGRSGGDATGEPPNGIGS